MGKSNTGSLPQNGPTADNGREVLLGFKNVDITFGKGDRAVRAVKNASFDIYKGETFSLVGESGSGKTTIGRAVIRANACTGGRIEYKGVPISGKLLPALERQASLLDGSGDAPAAHREGDDRGRKGAQDR